METQAQLRLLIVDGLAYAYRAFHAIRDLNSPVGAPTNAIYGFIKMLAKMRATLQPSHLSVIWDGGLSAQRMAALPEYKAQRPPMPDSLGRQISDIHRYLDASGVPWFCEDGVEADDLIATQARHAVAAGAGVVIASADKDFMQLVSPSVGLFNPNDKSETTWQAAQVRAKAGVEPEQIVDWLSLIGDTVDNIAGVPGVGPKTAADLLQQFGTIAALYERVSEVKSERVRAALQAAEPAVRRNQRLIRLQDDLPGGFSLEKVTLRRSDLTRLEALYADWGFNTMLAEVRAAAVTQGQLL